jgi:hypothetical protein
MEQKPIDPKLLNLVFIFHESCHEYMQKLQTDLCKQKEALASVLDVVSLDEIGMKDRIKAEIESHNEFQESVLGKEVKEKIKIKEIDIRNYAKHILRKRPMHEKRELLKHLRSKLVLKNKQLSLVEIAN